MTYFRKSVPVWQKNESDSKNTCLTFVSSVAGVDSTACCEIKIVANNRYRLRINGEFVSSGPARACKDYFRVDLIDISNYLTKSENKIEIDVVGYNTPTYQSIMQPAFLQCEVTVNGTVAAATGYSGFKAYKTPSRLTKTLKYSFQRSFVEAYDFKNDLACEVELEDLGDRNIIARGVHFPQYKVHHPSSIEYCFKLEKNNNPKYLDWNVCIQHATKIFEDEELDINSMKEYMDVSEHDMIKNNREVTYHKVDSMTGEIYGFERELTGFIGMDFKSDDDYQILISFDEVINNDILYPFRMGTCNVISVAGKKGKQHIETFEPFSLKYMKIYVLKGKVELQNVYLRTFENADADSFDMKFEDEDTYKIFSAAKETFKQNAVDIFTDCPSRERAGWLCDSFFTARTEKILTGQSLIEKNFLENFIMQDKYDSLPDGMIPMCFPSDHPNGNYIPNWAMWFILQLEEYLKRTGDTDLIKRAKNKAYKLWDFFKEYEDEYGLLEKLDAWVFVDWSKSNECVQDVSYPSNMMYYAMLMAIGRLYNDNKAFEAAEKLKTTINKKSYNGKFFIDNAVRNADGCLVNTNNTTEACQNYAFFTNIADDKSHNELFNIFVNEFGADRVEKGLYPEVPPAQAFIGNYLRLEVLSRYNKVDELKKNMKGFMLYMAEKTGTLWELVSDTASCNHGFASHIVYWLVKNGIK